ncbi:MAG: DNA translocase FtsK 4TM domain-containing protein [Acidobacteria bacterium]|nr:DNA translocase FtsK 4TM domain-containing protein [Acidobacteriota bacterium]
MKNTAIGDEELRTVSDPVWRILTGAAAFGAGVFVCGSVGSYVPSDPSWNAATGADVQNLFGSAGAVFADIARQILGWSGWIAGLALMIGGAMRAVLVGKPRIRRWVYGLVGVPLSAAAFAAWPVPETWPLSAGLGGMFGDGVFNLAVLPFRALMLPAPESWAGFLLGACALWAGLSALGFQRRDAVLLQETAARSGKHAAVGAAGVGGFLIRIGHQLSAQRPVRMEEGAAPSGDRTLVIKHDDDYLPSSRYLPQDDEDEDDSRYGASAWDDDDEAGEDDDTPATVPAPGLRFAVPRHQPKTTASPKVSKPERRRTSTRLPSLNLLQVPPERRETFDEDALLAKAARLSEVLKEFGIQGRIKEVRPGPVITLFEMEPAPGVKSSRVITLADDIARSMSAVSARVAVVPGKNAIGIELPNDERETVYLRSILQSEAYVNSRATLPVAVGEDIGGMPTVLDLARMPHLLVAGTTGSGKSVGVNAMILSLLYRHTPEQVRFIMIDPKKLEFTVYEGIPHLLAPVITKAPEAVNALKWAVREMESRYELMSKAGVRNLAGFNEKAAKYRAAGEQLVSRAPTTGDSEILPIDHIPQIVVVIDEMSDLMVVAGKEIEGCLLRLAQMARAAGIHLITATQRPSVDVITGTIKANFPTRISYMVTNKVDSRTILNEQGAEQLLGHGDLLHQEPGKKTQRLHGPFVSDEEVCAVADWLREQGEPDYVMDVLESADDGSTGSPVMDAMLGMGDGSSGGGGDDDNALFSEAVQVVIRDQRASTSYLQRRLKVGYNKAAGLIDRLEEEGVISAPNHAGKREVLTKGKNAA